MRQSTSSLILFGFIFYFTCSAGAQVAGAMSAYELCLQNADDLKALIAVSDLHWRIKDAQPKDGGFECNGIFEGVVPYGQEHNVKIAFQSPVNDTSKIDGGIFSCKQAAAECGKITEDCNESLYIREIQQCKTAKETDTLVPKDLPKTILK